MSNSNGSQKNTLALMADQFASARRAYLSGQYADIENLYRAARKTRFTKSTNQIQSEPTTEDWHYQSEYDYFRIVSIAQQLDRDDMIVGQGVNRAIGNVVQQGFMLDPKTGDDTANALIKEKWNAWANDRRYVDHEQQKTFSDFERLAMRHVWVDGDVVSLFLETGALQLVENHRLRTPGDMRGSEASYVVHGVHLDKDRRRVRYYLTKDTIDTTAFPTLRQVSAYTPIDSDGNPNLLHLYYPRRMTQTRGVSRLCPITDAAAMHDDIQFSKLVQQQGVSVWSMIRSRPEHWQPPEGYVDEISREPDPCRPGETRPIRNVAAGMWYTTLPGETVSGFSPNVPNPTFFDHARQIMQFVAINLDLPLIVFLLDSSETNFSGWRGSMDQAKIQFRNYQNWYTSAFHRPVFEWKMRQWSTPGSPHADPWLVRMRQRGINVFGHTWTAPTWPYIEPLKDTTVDLVELGNSLASPRRIQQRRGLDYDEVIREVGADRWAAFLIGAEYAQRARQECPWVEDPPSWQWFVPMPMAEGTQMALQQLLAIDKEEVTREQEKT